MEENNAAGYRARNEEIMNRFVDIHHHLIYGVDDGARTFEDMQEMIRRAVEENVGDIVCTSHATPGGRPFPMERYHRHMQQAREWIDEMKLPLRLHSGCEVLYTDTSARLLAEKQYPSLADSKSVLIEFNPDTEFRRFCDAARMIGNEGFDVIFAHVERYQALRNLNHVRELRESYGVFMQMNTSTIVNRKGFFFERWVRHILEEGYIDCVATDSHNVTNRCCNMRLCHEMLKARYGSEMADELCGGFQRDLLDLPAEV